MTGEKAERFVVLNLRLMAIGFAITGFFFIAWPDGTLARLTELGHHFGFHTPAPKTEERLWLSLGFAYMVVITFLAWIASTDVVRYRPMILALAAGKAASSVTSLIFFIEDDVFAYLLNGIVDGSLVFASLLLWSLAGPGGSPAGWPRARHPPEAAGGGSGPPSFGLCGGSRRQSPLVRTGFPRPRPRSRSPSPWHGSSPSCRPAPCRWCGSPCAPSSSCRSPGGSAG